MRTFYEIDLIRVKKKKLQNICHFNYYRTTDINNYKICRY